MNIAKIITRYTRILSAGIWLTVPLLGAAQPKDQVLKVISAGPAGASVDFVSRLLADGLQKELQRIVIVENKAGAGGLLAANELIKLPADGNTLFVTLDGLQSELPHLIKLKFDIAKEIKPIAQLARSGLAIAGNPSLPAKSLADIINYAKANPGKLSYASYGTGGASHVIGVQLNDSAKIELTHVPYKGATQAVLDASGGHVPIIVAGIGNLLPIIKNGSVIPYAVSLPQRSPFLPDVPTFVELGYPNIQITVWMGLWVRPDVPLDIQTAMRNAALKVMSSPSTIEKLATFGLEPGETLLPEELSESLRKAYDKRGAELKKINYKAQ